MQISTIFPLFVLIGYAQGNPIVNSIYSKMVTISSRQIPIPVPIPFPPFPIPFPPVPAPFPIPFPVPVAVLKAIAVAIFSARFVALLANINANLFGAGIFGGIGVGILGGLPFGIKIGKKKKECDKKKKCKKDHWDDDDWAKRSDMYKN